MPVKFDIAGIIIGIVGALVALLGGSGVRYVMNNAKSRISSSVNRRNLQDANAMTSESLVLQAAQMQQQENADLRKEQKEMYAGMLKMATEFGKAQGKLEALQPPQNHDVFADAVMVEPEQETSKGSTELEFLPKSQRKPHILAQEKSNDFNFGEDFQARARSSKGGTRTNTDTDDYAA